MAVNRRELTIARVLLLVTFALGIFAEPASALGVIETPEHLSTETGIGVIGGWHCDGDLIQIQIDGGELITMASHTPRGDTSAVCGREDTGFSTLLNFSRLDESVRHEVVAYADGVEFDRVIFRTVNFGVRYLTDQKGECSLHNFPEPGDTTVMAWSEEKQNFSVIGTRTGGGLPSVSGTYYGAAGCNACGDVPKRHGVFTIALTDSRLTLLAEYLDGRACSFSAEWRIESGGSVVANNDETATMTCRDFGGPFYLRIDGELLTGQEIEVGGINLAAARLR